MTIATASSAPQAATKPANSPKLGAAQPSPLAASQ